MADELLAVAACLEELSIKLAALKDLYAGDLEASARVAVAQVRARKAVELVERHIELSGRTNGSKDRDGSVRSGRSGSAVMSHSLGWK